jgi:hypothetical protein
VIAGVGDVPIGGPPQFGRGLFQAHVILRLEQSNLSRNTQNDA